MDRLKANPAIARGLAACAAGLLFLGLAVPAAAAPEAAEATSSGARALRVLALHTYSSGSLFRERLDQALISTLTANGRAVEYDEESLEADRFTGPEHLALMRDHLARKYAGVRIDAIVAIWDPAVRFLLAHRDELFTGVPIIAAATDHALMARAGLTGARMQVNLLSAVEMALSIDPAVKRVVVVDGVRGNAGSISREVETLRPLASRVELTYLKDRTLDDVLDAVRVLPPDALVMYVRQLMRNADENIDQATSLTAISAASAVPVYGVVDGLVGRGIVGGLVVDSASIGRALAPVVTRVADGAAPSTVPSIAIAPVPMFDARQLARWKIQEARLPHGSTVLFRETSLWQTHRLSVVAAGVVLIGQLLLIAGLMVQRARRRRAEDDLRSSEDRYRTVVDTQSEMICRYLPDTTLTFVNEAYCKCWGRTPAQLIGTSFLDLIPSSAHDSVRAMIASHVTGGNPSAVFEHEVVRPDGAMGWHQWVDSPIKSPDGKVVELQGIGRDITDQRRAEESLRTTQARSNAILRAVPDLMFVMTKEGTYLDFHARDEKLLYVTPETFIGRNMSEVLPPALVAEFREAFERVDASDEPIVVEYSLDVDGVVGEYEARLVSYEGDRILSIVRDITAQRRSEALVLKQERAIRESSELNQVLAGRLIASQEEERQRVARELHDDLSQKLALLSIEIGRFGRDFAANQTASAWIQQICDQAGDIASDVHRLSHELHPAKLQQLGLVTAMRSLCRDISSQHPVNVEFTHDGILDAIQPAVSLCLYRVVQEALHNVIKHSGASYAQVQLVDEGDHLSLRVADAGKGFSLVATERAGLGLVSMRERANFLGGQLIIRSAPGQGTRIGVRVPKYPAGIPRTAESA